MAGDPKPALSLVIPTFNNLDILKRCLESWEQLAGGQPVELLVIEDGCSDGTARYLREKAQSDWGRRHLRWFHEDDVHALRCTNRGFKEASGDLLVAWQDDMFLAKDWFVPELLRTFAAYADIGLLALSRALNFFPLDEPIQVWEDLHDERRLQSTLGKRPLNWLRITEVDGVIRPWVVRKQCLDRAGLLDEAFAPDEWDETDLCFRIRQAGWKAAVHGYERLGAYRHLGSSTLSREASERLKQRVLPNGQLFHQRWDAEIQRQHARTRRTWLRRSSFRGWSHTLIQMSQFALSRTKTRSLTAAARQG